MNGTPKDTTAQRRPAPKPFKRQNGAAIRALREKDGWSQAALAKAAGIRQPSLSDIESERVNAHTTTLNLLARAMRVPVGAIMREPESGEVIDLASANGRGAA